MNDLSLSVFLSSMSVPVVMIDAHGHKVSVSRPDNVSAAMAASNAARALNGNGHVTIASPEHDSVADRDFVLFWEPGNSSSGRSSLARVASVIAASRVSGVSGNRCVAWLPVPHFARRGSAVPFIVSRTVWFNDNRRTELYPSRETLEACLNDINGRLLRGSVSVPRT